VQAVGLGFFERVAETLCPKASQFGAQGAFLLLPDGQEGFLRLVPQPISLRNRTHDISMRSSIFRTMSENATGTVLFPQWNEGRRLIHAPFVGCRTDKPALTDSYLGGFRD